MFNNLNSTLKKVVVVFLIITLTYANLVLIGTNIVQGLFSYALEKTEEQNLVVSNQKLVMNKVYGQPEEQKRIIQVALETGIESEECPIKESTIILGTDLIEASLLDVKVTELNKNSYTTGTWEVSEEGKLVVSLVNENETLETKEKGFDKFLVTYVFENSEVETIKQPLESIEVTRYNEEILINEFTTTDFENIDVEKELLLLNIENKDIHKTTIESGKVDYIETLNLDLSYRNDATNITIEDVSNDFYNVDEQENEEVALKYIKTVLNREDLSNLLGETGKLVITDNKTNKELITLTNEKLAIEESEKQYYGEDEDKELRSELSIVDNEVIIEFSIDVESLKIELVDMVPQSNTNIDISDFVIENTKSILNVNDIENLSYLEENVKYIVNEEKVAQSIIKFKDTVTRASLEVDNDEWVVGETNKVNYTITLDTTTEKSELFRNPIFLIELPSSVESINSENSQFTVNNDNGVFTNKNVFITTVLGRRFVVITLTGEQTEESIQTGNTTINLSLELNVKQVQEDQTTKLYYQNNTVTVYESGKSFDTAEIDVSLIINNEEKEEIYEEVEGVTDFSVSLASSTNNVIQPGDTLKYTLYLNNYGLKEYKDVLVTQVLPEGVTLEEVLEIVDDEEQKINYEYSEDTRTLEINLDKLQAATEEEIEDEQTGEKGFYIKSNIRIFNIIVKANSLEEATYSREVKNSVTVKIGKDTFTTDEVVNRISDVFLVVEPQNVKTEINENEQTTFEVRITNKGLIDAYQLDCEIDLSEYIELIMTEYGVLGEEELESTASGNKYEQTLIDIPAEKTYFIRLTGDVKELEETKAITVTGTIDGQEFSWNTKLIDVPGNSEDPNNPENPNEPEEPNDPENPNEPEEPNDPENPNGPEKPNNPEDPNNPADSNSPEEIIDGFDLSLTQYLNKIEVTNSQGTTKYEYTDTNFAKVEIHSKYMNGSKVTLEYKIVVRNNGTVPGYARKIVDYLPEGLEFDQELNKDWYLGDDGNIYSVALIDKLLNSGETAELTIILTKQMTNEDGGTIKNIMEIYEASNDENLEDLNSIPGDKLEGQNDMSTVEVIVAVKTGTVILYVTLGIVVIAIIGIGFYKIKKVTLNKKGGC